MGPFLLFYIDLPKQGVWGVLLIDPELPYQDWSWTYLTDWPGLVKQKGRHGGQKMTKKLEACHLYYLCPLPCLAIRNCLAPSRSGP